MFFKKPTNIPQVSRSKSDKENEFLGHEIRWICKQHPFPVFVFDHNECCFWVKLFFRGSSNSMKIYEIHIDNVDLPKYLWRRSELKQPMEVIKSVSDFLLAEMNDKFEQILKKVAE